MQFQTNHLQRFLLATMTIAGTVAIFNLAVDPLQIFHRNRFIPPRYSDDSRQQNAGLIQSEDFDTVFIGTSLGIHFRRKEIDEILGVKSVKLAMSGANSREQSFVLEAALGKSGVKTVIWESDYWTFRAAREIDDNLYLPANLYRRNIQGFARYLFSLDTGRESVWQVLREAPLLNWIGLQLTRMSYVKLHYENVDEIGVIPSYVDISTLYNADKAKAAYRLRGIDRSDLGTGYATLNSQFRARRYGADCSPSGRAVCNLFAAL